MTRLAFISLLALGACSRDAAYESGRPDARRAPRSADEAMAQAAEITERAAALKTKGLCTSEAVRAAAAPDERFWHCMAQDWNGSTRLKGLLERFNSEPEAWVAFCNPFNFDPAQLTLCEGTAAQASARKASAQNDPWDWRTRKPKAGDK